MIKTLLNHIRIKETYSTNCSPEMKHLAHFWSKMDTKTTMHQYNTSLSPGCGQQSPRKDSRAPFLGL